MPTRRTNRKHTTQPTAAKVKELSALAKKIDAEERGELSDWARGVFDRHEALQQVIQSLKAERMEQGLSLADIDARTGIGRSNLCRLENAPDANPTIETLQRYADALNKQILVTLTDAKHASRKRRAG